MVSSAFANPVRTLMQALAAPSLNCLVQYGNNRMGWAQAAATAQAETGLAVLAAQCFDAVPAAPLETPFPLQHVSMPRLNPVPDVSSGGCCELWLSDAPLRYGRAGAIHYGCNEQLLFGVMQLDAPALATLSFGAAVPSLQQMARAAYSELFALLDAEAYPHLWRVWNYLADINGKDDVVQGSLERYRLFNVGRHEAFETHGRLQRAQVPAACALGTAAGTPALSLAFLAARNPAQPIENPRQMSAYEYPTDYGPRSPTFARATQAWLQGQVALFVSGTASIIGHATVHADDVLAQTRETVINLRELFEEASRQGMTAGASAPTHLPRPWQLGDFGYRVYLRHAADAPAVQALLGTLLGREARVEYVQADVCRADLLVEIEALGLMPVR